ncbi:tetratricopeptide repeat protein 39A isoform X1 [Tetranychus urticae]|uniref:Tetratricopeptide repeat protein 39B n=1 Tax=Tetranychus urticae TaxID=32264 RepID=T1K249_TETUR|nr:tetratricopeptide repeat protein 39A isoform X1 [Tetranychus urticae]
MTVEVEQVYDEPMESASSGSQQSLSSSTKSDVSFCTTNSGDQSLDDALEEGRELMKMFINNKMDEVLPILQEKANSSMIHALGVAAVRFFEAILTLDKSYLQSTIEAFKYSSAFADSLRRKSYTSFLFSPNYNGYTDEECHAELCYAKSLLLWGLVTVLEDQSIYGFINGALKIRASHQSYKECLAILKHKNTWDSEISRMHFESGTRLGIGAFDLVISFFPTKMAKLLEFVGFNSDRDVALEELNMSVNLVDGLLYDVTSILLSGYYGFLEYFYGLGEGDVEFFNRSSKIWLVRTPESAIVKLGLGVREKIIGNPDKAIEYYVECIKGQSFWRQLNFACYWEIIWCYAMKCDWEKAANYARLLKDDCKWSPAMFTYLYAVFTFMVMEENDRPDLEQDISKAFLRIPQLKRRFGGKRAFHEKIVIERSRKYHDKVKQMLLPPFELLYIWNIFKMMASNQKLIQAYLDKIDAKLAIHKKSKDDQSSPLDAYCYLKFMKGVCYRHLNQLVKSIDCFTEVLNCKKRIDEETHLLPQSAFELGLIHRSMGQNVEAKKWLKKSRDDYSGYLTETMIHYRVQCALSSLKQ